MLAHGIQIDLSRDSLFTEFGMETLRDRYLLPGESSPQEAFARVSRAFADDLKHAQRIYDYVSKLWFMFATPILSNGGTKRGLPISCFLSSVDDSRLGLTNHYTENAFLASVGGGIGSYWGHVRSNGTGTSSGSKSTGSIPFLKVVDSEVMAFHQGTTRRGSYAAYQDVSHPEIEEFIGIRKPTGGDTNRKCLNIHHGVNVTDEFMRAVVEGNEWNLRDPHSGAVTKSVPARSLWEAILETRVATGEPYIHFIDTTNRLQPEAHKNLGLRVSQSNLCSEITLPTDSSRTAVCCLSSVNLEKFEEWEHDPLFIEDLVRFLDNVLTSFIKTAPEQLWRAAFSAMRERSIGLGAMGFHSYLQSKNIPFESALATGINRKVFSLIKDQAYRATKKLAGERGPAPDALENDPVRNIHLIAIAPNASSSIICGNTSPSIEPLRANAFTQKTMSGSFLVKNVYLEKLLEEIGQNTVETWRSIITNRGSVQQLAFLNEWQKDVFKTAMELDQHWIIEHAATRQQWVCQSQSVNLFLPADAHRKYLHSVHMMAWKRGLKTLYYLRSETVSRTEVISTKIPQAKEDNECYSCHG